MPLNYADFATSRQNGGVFGMINTFRQLQAQKQATELNSLQLQKLQNELKRNQDFQNTVKNFYLETDETGQPVTEDKPVLDANGQPKVDPQTNQPVVQKVPKQRDLSANPIPPEAYLRLATEYPEFATGIKTAYETKSKIAQARDVQDQWTIYDSLLNNDIEGAKEQLNALINDKSRTTQEKVGYAQLKKRLDAGGKDAVINSVLTNLAFTINPDQFSNQLKNLQEMKVQKTSAEKGQIELSELKDKREATLAGTLRDPEAKARLELAFNEKYHNETKNFDTVRESYRRIAAIDANKSSVPGVQDIALIFNYMKMLDPTSTVREGEFKSVGQSGGLPASVQNYFNLIIGEGQLTPAQRAAIKDQAKKFLDAAKEKVTEVQGSMSETVKHYGLDPKNVFFVGSKDEPDATPEKPEGEQSFDLLDPAKKKIEEKTGVPYEQWSKMTEDQKREHLSNSGKSK